MKKTRAQRRREARMAEVVRLRDKGWSLREIASHLDVGKSTVERDLASPKPSQTTVPDGTESVPNGTAKRDSNIIQFQRRAS
jgi:transposase